MIVSATTNVIDVNTIDVIVDVRLFILVQLGGYLSSEVETVWWFIYMDRIMHAAILHCGEQRGFCAFLTSFLYGNCVGSVLCGELCNNESDTAFEWW